MNDIYLARNGTVTNDIVVNGDERRNSREGEARRERDLKEGGKNTREPDGSSALYTGGHRGVC